MRAVSISRINYQAILPAERTQSEPSERVSVRGSRRVLRVNCQTWPYECIGSNEIPHLGQLDEFAKLPCLCPRARAEGRWNLPWNNFRFHAPASYRALRCEFSARKNFGGRNARSVIYFLGVPAILYADFKWNSSVFGVGIKGMSLSTKSFCQWNRTNRIISRKLLESFDIEEIELNSWNSQNSVSFK